MSAIAAVVHLLGHQLEPAVLSRVASAMEDCGPDGSGHWLAGCAGLVHHSLALTAEELGVPQPMVLRDLVGVFDGRLDNRDELIGQLINESTAASPTDAELAVRSFDRWRHDAPRHLLGDFGLAVWDVHRRELFCARDHLGVRPLYYAVHGNVLVIATDIRGVLAHPTLPREPNEQHVAEILMDDVTNRTDTLYEGVLRLPPAHTLSIRDGAITTDRYWDVDLVRELSYSDDEEYLAHFLELIHAATQSRLRTTAPVAIALSGGLDSSLLSGIAMTTDRAPRGFTPSITGVGLVFPGLACDESEWIRAAASSIDMELRELPWEPLTWSQVCSEASRTMYLPPLPNMTVDRFVWAGMSRTVVMTGIGGDQWMAGHYGYFRDLLAAHDFVGLGRSVLRGEGPMLAHAVREHIDYRASVVRHRFPRSEHHESHRSLLGPALEKPARASRAASEALLALPRPAGVDRCKHQRYKTLHYPWEPYVLELSAQAVGGGNLVCVAPFYDRRVVEFAVALPDHQRWRGRDFRWLQRRALRRIGLANIADRRTKPEFSSISQRAVAVLADTGFPASPTIARLGWVVDDFAIAPSETISNSERGRGAASPRERWLVAAVEAWARAAWD
jgi:asparagine synthase (glutamine-hydrolysing)